MFIAAALLLSTLRSVRSEICFQVPHAKSCCAPTEREPYGLTSDYKHLALLGRNPIAASFSRSGARVPFLNDPASRDSRPSAMENEKCEIM